MNKLIVLLAIVSACGAEPSALPPDAAQLPIDAALSVDAARPRDAAIDTPVPQPESRGCMGNLPTSRTVTVNTGDPVSPNLLNELQDMAVGARRGQFIRRITPHHWGVIGGAAAMVPNPSTSPVSLLGEPVWQFTGTGSYRAELDYEVGEIVSGMAIDSFGDGTVDWSIQLLFSTSMSTETGTVTQVVADSYTNETASWHRRTPAVVTPSTTLADGGKLVVLISISGATTLCVGKLSLFLSK